MNVFLLISIILTVPAVKLIYSEKIQPLVIGGSDANISIFPWVVSIRQNNQHVCGGSILSNYWILSSAQCSGNSVQYGVSNISVDGTTIIQIYKWFRHLSYTGELGYADIAVVKLFKPIVYSQTAGQVRLPVRYYEVPGNWETAAIVAGWGLNETSGILETKLKSVSLLVASHEECQKLHAPRMIYGHNLCAGQPNVTSGLCSGDNGSPLFLDGGQQIGFVSWSLRPCGNPTYPGVYTKVSYYIDWIRQITGLAL